MQSGGIEIAEHYLLHCEHFFNEREAMRATLSKQVGITELTIELLLRCNNSNFNKEYGMTIMLALFDFITQIKKIKSWTVVLLKKGQLFVCVF